MENFLSEIHSLFEDRVLLEQVIGYDTEDLTKMIINQRKNNLRNYAENSKNFLINKGRCPICTLIIPCKHYQECLSSKSQSPFLIENKERQTSFTPDSCLMLQSFPSQFKNQKLEKKRLKLLKDLENFREKKINSEINKIKQTESQKLKDIENEKLNNMKRKKYAEIQRKKVAEYKEQKIRKSLENDTKQIKIRKPRKISQPSKFKSKIEEIDAMLTTQLSLINNN